MAMTYASFVSSLANMLVVDPANDEYLAVIPSIIADAEQRVYRDLDLLATIVRDSTSTLTANSRSFTFPQHFVVSEEISVFTPVTTRTTRKQLVPVSREWLDLIYGSETASSVDAFPQYYAMVTDQTILVGPAPGAAFYVEVVGTVRPEPLSATNTTTYLTEYLPDLFFAAALVFGAGYQKNFSEMGDQPQAAAGWEAHYQKLFNSANVEEMRKKYSSQAWTSKQPAPLAIPQRV